MVVDRKGKVTKVKLAPGSEGMAHEQLENEALRVVNKLPDFRPGRQQGRAANVRYTIPIIFNLE